MKSKTPEAVAGYRGGERIGDTNPVPPSGPASKVGVSSAAQRARVLAHLRKASLTTLEARQFLDVLHPAARVMELRKAGYQIVTHWTDDMTAEGRSHRVARYILKEGA